MASVETEYKRRRRKVWAVGGIAAAALYAGGGYFYDTGIEDDLETRVPEAIAESGTPGVRAEFSGQNGTLFCDSPIEDPEAALATARDVRGVYKIDTDESCRTNTAPEEPAEPTDTTESAPASEYMTVGQIVEEETDFQQLSNRLSDSELAAPLGDEDAGPYTVFAPTNEGFGKVSDDELNALDPDPELRDQVLGHHVVEGNIVLDELNDGDELTTLNGDKLPVAIKDEMVTIGGANVTSGPFTADNGVVYGIDTVLLPDGVSLAPQQPPAEVAAAFESGAITLSGVVASDAERNVLVEAATAQVGAENVTDNLTVDAEAGANAETAGDVADLIGGMGTNLVSGEVGANADGLYANGLYADDDQKDAMTAVTDGMGATADLQPRPEADASSAAELQDQLNAYVAENPILFEPSSAVISDQSADVIEKIANQMQEIGGLKILVEGHTDTDGNPVFNQQLSEQRAAAVAEDLVERGVPLDAVSAVGYGAEQPIIIDGVENKDASRRVVFQLEATGS